MDSWLEFDRRIAAIHGIDNLNLGSSDREGTVMDVRHEEFQAMSEAFLGKDYGREKLQQIERLQIALHEQQAALYQRHENKDISSEQYVNSLNTLLDTTFAKCEEVLGLQDFVRLFGAPGYAFRGLVDREALLRSAR